MSPMIWIAAGCGLLSIFGCCLGSGVAFFAYRAQEQEQEQRSIAMGRGQPDFGGGTPNLGGGVAPGPAPSPLVIPMTPMPSIATRSIVASVQSVAGSVPVTPGSFCYVIIEVKPQTRQPAGYWCKSTVTCNGTVLYGETATNGFFPCAAYDSPAAVLGEDGETTTIDTDGSIQLDTNRRTLILRDDHAGTHGAFRIEAQVTEVH